MGIRANRPLPAGPVASTRGSGAKGNAIQLGAAVGTRKVRVTSFDVAALAQVSQSTVSRALSGDSSISEATRLRVAEAARQLDYFGNENAIRLRTGRTNTLAVVVICREEEDKRDVNPFHYSLLGAICAAASARRYEVLVSFQSSRETLFAHYQDQRKADGLIVIGTTDNQAAWDYFHSQSDNISWVCWGSPFDDLEWVRSDNHQGGRIATRHLLDQGYRRVVCLASLDQAQKQFVERFDGYAQVMRDAGLEPRLSRIEEGLPREQQGRAAIAGLLEYAEGFDAVFAVSDLIALGAMAELHDRGISVPGDVGVVGFDALRQGAYSTPALTSIEPDFDLAGRMLVENLLTVIEGHHSESRRVPVRLLIRGSSVRVG